jgi:hypothetical protein
LAALSEGKALVTELKVDRELSRQRRRTG